MKGILLRLFLCLVGGIVLRAGVELMIACVGSVEWVEVCSVWAYLLFRVWGCEGGISGASVCACVCCVIILLSRFDGCGTFPQ